MQAQPTFTLQDIFNLIKVSPVLSTDDLKARYDNQRFQYACLSYDADHAWRKHSAAIDNGASAGEIEQLAVTAEILQAKAHLAYHLMDELAAKILGRNN
jgi:hypothetical protein